MIIFKGFHKKGIVSITKLDIPIQGTIFNRLILFIEVFKQSLEKGGLFWEWVIGVASKFLVHFNQILCDLKIQISQLRQLLANGSHFLWRNFLFFIE